jgi:hypothetical protein
MRLRVLSGRLDAYLLPLLEPVGVRADEGTFVRARFTAEGTAAVVEEIAAGRCVPSVGDGSNDGAVAERATLVLARRRLLEHRRARGIAHAPFDDFRDMATWIARWVGG